MGYTRKHLVADVAQATGLTTEEVRVVLDATTTLVGDELASGNVVRWAEFGSFELRVRKAHERKHPITGRPVTIPPGKVVRFRAHQALRDRVQQSPERE